MPLKCRKIEGRDPWLFVANLILAEMTLPKGEGGARPGSGAVDLETLAGTSDHNERLSILLKLLKQASPEMYEEVYLSLMPMADLEKRLVLQTMFQVNVAGSLEFVEIYDPDGMKLAMAIALEVNPNHATAWAQLANVRTMDLVEHEDEQMPDEKIDEWIAASREAREGQEVPDWTKDFPSGKPVKETVEEVVQLSATHSNRGRYWLVNSKDTRARMRAAGDIGWESDDMGWDEFDQWLLDLPVELAEAALAGRLERLAAENPGNSELLLDTLDRYSEVYQLDQSFYLMALRLINVENGEQALIGQMIARIDAVELKYEAEEVAISYYGESFSSGAMSSSAAVMMLPDRDSGVGSFMEAFAREDPAVALEWASTIDDPTMRAEVINSVTASWVREDPAAAGEWLGAFSPDPVMNNAADRTSLNLSSSQSASRGAPGGFGRRVP